MGGPRCQWHSELHGEHANSNRPIDFNTHSSQNDRFSSDQGADNCKILIFRVQLLQARVVISAGCGLLGGSFLWLWSRGGKQSGKAREYFEQSKQTYLFFRGLAGLLLSKVMEALDQVFTMLRQLMPCCIPRRSAAIFVAVDEAVAQGSLDAVRKELKRSVTCTKSVRIKVEGQREM